MRIYRKKNDKIIKRLRYNMWNLLRLLPFESIGFFGINLPVQTLYVFQLFAPVILFYYLVVKQKKLIFTPVFTIIILYIGYVITVTFFSVIFFDYINANSFFRQLIALNLGVITFLSLRYIFLYTSSEKILRTIKFSIIVIAIFSMYDILIKGYTRVYSTYTEPSHLAYDIVLIYLFSLIMYRKLMSLTNFFYI